MSNKSDLPALPPSVQRVVPVFRYGGWISFWVQSVLALIAGGIILFAVATATAGSKGVPGQNNPGTGPGIFFAICGLVALGLSIYWAFRYTRLAQQLSSSNPSNRPKKADATQLLRYGLIVNLVGMTLTLMGAEAIAGTLLAKSFQSTGIGFSINSGLNQLIQPVDIFVVLGNTHIIVAHFTGILTAIWLLNWVNRE